MSSIRNTARATAVAAVALGLAAGTLAGCTTSTAPSVTASSTSAPSPTTAAVPAGEGAVGPDEQAVAAVLRTYQQAIAVGDYPLACTQMTAESAGQLVTAVQAATPTPVPGCAEALRVVVTQPGAADAAIEAASSITVTDVTIEGLSATVRWSSTRQGVARSDGLTLQQIDGQWRLAGPA